MNILVPQEALNTIFENVAELEMIQKASPAHAQEAIGGVISALTI